MDWGPYDSCVYALCIFHCVWVYAALLCTCMSAASSKGWPGYGLVYMCFCTHDKRSFFWLACTIINILCSLARCSHDTFGRAITQVF